MSFSGPFGLMVYLQQIFGISSTWRAPMVEGHDLLAQPLDLSEA